jgi:diguanylate cyclase (GGDEF)-like protein
MSILVVDDSPAIRDSLCAILRAGGHADVVSVGGGREAVEYLQSLGPDPSPPIRLILLDVLMPDMDGIEALRRIKALAPLRDVPVLMVTAVAEPEILRTAFAAGAMDYLTKPFNRVELLARVQSALTLVKEMEARKRRERDLVAVTHQLEQVIEELRRLSAIDSLTGVANRRRLEEVLDEEWRRAGREDESLALVLVDVDNFKPYNDHYGHAMGDYALKRVGGVLQSSIHRPADLVARYGGDEFIVVLPGTDKEGAHLVAERIRLGVLYLGIEHVAPDSGAVITLSVSVGVASSVPTGAQSPGSLFLAADAALYDAKRAGRNRTNVYRAARLPDPADPAFGHIPPRD